MIILAHYVHIKILLILYVVVVYLYEKNKMLKIINDINYYNQNNHQPEDVFF